MKLFRRNPRTLPDEVVAESNGAQLVRREGKLSCRCPFACLATYEPCEFGLTRGAWDD